MSTNESQPPFHPHTRVVVEGFRVLHKHLEEISGQLIAIDSQVKEIRKEQLQIAAVQHNKEKQTSQS